MKMTPYFSIIVPMYNVERYIKICVDSILAQTFKDFEVIIIDDVSTDDSYKICNELYGGNEKVRLLRHEKNQGGGPARNTGIKKSVGKYIWFVDSDDVIIPTALEKLYKATHPEAGGVDVVHLLGRYTIYQDDDKPLVVQNLHLEWEKRTEGFLNSNKIQRINENWINNRIWIATYMGCYKKSFLVKNKIWFPIHSRVLDDFLVAFSAILYAEKYYFFKEALYVYRGRKDSVTRSPNINKGLETILDVVDTMIKVMKKIPELSDQRIIKEQCIAQAFEYIFPSHFIPFYNGVNVSPELDKAVYENLLPIFGGNTTLVKYLFHGFNTMWRQASILSQQVYLLRQREELFQKQNKLIEQLRELLKKYDQTI